MSWVMVGVTAAGVVKGGMDAKSNEKQQERLDASRKATIMYSPWTGMQDPGYQSAGNTNMLSGALGGGMQGAAMGSMFGGGAGAGGAQAQGQTSTWGMVDKPSTGRMFA